MKMPLRHTVVLRLLMSVHLHRDTFAATTTSGLQNHKAAVLIGDILRLLKDLAIKTDKFVLQGTLVLFLHLINRDLSEDMRSHSKLPYLEFRHLPDPRFLEDLSRGKEILDIRQRLVGAYNKAADRLLLRRRTRKREMLLVF